MNQPDSTVTMSKGSALSAVRNMARSLLQDIASFGPRLGSDFDFTLLFEQSMFNILPGALFIVCAVYYYWKVWRAPRLVKAGHLFRFKMFFGVVLIASEIALLALFSQTPRFRTLIGIVAGSLSTVSALFVTFTLFAEHFYSVCPSHMLSIYLTIGVLLDVLQIYSLFHRELKAQFIIQILSCVAKTGLLALEEVSKRSLFINEDLKMNTSRQGVSGFLGRTLYFWLNATFLRGYRTILKIEDLDKFDNDLKSKTLAHRFQRSWDEGDSSSQYRLLWALLGTVGSQQIAIALCTCLLSVLCMYSQPFIITLVVEAVDDPDLTNLKVVALVAASALAYSGAALFHAINQQAIARCTTTFRSCSIAASFSKAMTIDSANLRRNVALTLLTSDIAGFQVLPMRINAALSSVASVVGGLIYLIIYVKETAVVVIVPVAFCTITSFIVGRKIKRAQTDWNSATEKRMATIDTLLSKFKSVRMAGLGSAFSEFVNAKLGVEIDASKRYRFYNAVLFSIDLVGIAMTPVLILLATYLWTNRSGLPTADVYALLTVIGLIADPLGIIVHSFSHLAKCMACHDRIQDFLFHDELVDVRGGVEPPKNANQPGVTGETSIAGEAPRNPDLQSESHAPASNDTSTSAVVQEEEKVAALIKNVGTAPTSEGDQILQDVHATILANKFTIVTGAVGSGKTSVFKLLLGEASIVEGEIGIDGRDIGYCSQIPWLRNQSVRENIIGPNPMRDVWYTTVTNACGLDVDFNSWPEGDATIAGSSASKLSGGQKQRIALARAIYSKASLLLLDDVFSGLDQHTAARVFNNLLGTEGILRQARATVLLATHSAEYLPSADCILHLKSDSVISQINAVPTQDGVTEPKVAPIVVDLNGESLNAQGSRTDWSVVPRESNTDVQNGDTSPPSQTSKKRPVRKGSMHLFHFESFGVYHMIAFVILTGLGELVYKFPNIFLSIWLQHHKPSDSGFLLGYSVIAVVSIIFCTLTIGWFLAVLIANSYKSLHTCLLEATLRANSRFIATTEKGSILNRFGQDITVISQELPYLLLHLLMYCFAILVDLAVIANGSPYAAGVIVLFIALMMVVRRFYQRTSVQLRLLQLGAMAPIYNLFTDVAAGIEHIRAFNWQPSFETELLENLDHAQTPFYQLLCVQQWLILVMDLGVAGLAILVVCLALLIPKESSANGLGLALVKLVTFGRVVSIWMRAWTDYDITLGAVTRIQDFSKTTPQEPQPGTEGDANRLWPTDGAIQFKKMSMRFDPDDLKSRRIVGGVTFTAQPGQRIGVVGRTGSGKSSLMMAVLGMMQYEGSIKIDGVELRKISGDTLRSRITTIGQESVILPGSVRYNLYPYAPDMVSDDAMIEVLDKVGLWEHLKSHGELDACVVGLELSQGQQQLLNIARGMIHHIHEKTKIVFLDEVASQLDLLTDERVHRAIDEVFSECTVVAIAHRLDNLQEMDAILTVANGTTTFAPQTRRSRLPPSPSPEVEAVEAVEAVETFNAVEAVDAAEALEAVEVMETVEALEAVYGVHPDPEHPDPEHPDPERSPSRGRAYSVRAGGRRHRQSASEETIRCGSNNLANLTTCEGIELQHLSAGAGHGHAALATVTEREDNGATPEVDGDGDGNRASRQQRFHGTLLVDRQLNVADQEAAILALATHVLLPLSPVDLEKEEADDFTLQSGRYQSASSNASVKSRSGKSQSSKSQSSKSQSSKSQSSKSQCSKSQCSKSQSSKSQTTSLHPGTNLSEEEYEALMNSPIVTRREAEVQEPRNTRELQEEAERWRKFDMRKTYDANGQRIVEVEPGQTGDPGASGTVVLTGDGRSEEEVRDGVVGTIRLIGYGPSEEEPRETEDRGGEPVTPVVKEDDRSEEEPREVEDGGEVATPVVKDEGPSEDESRETETQGEKALANIAMDDSDDEDLYSAD